MPQIEPAFNPPRGGRADETKANILEYASLVQLSTHPEAGGLMKLGKIGLGKTTLLLSTHPEAGGLMKPRPLKPLSTQADKCIIVG